MTADFNVILNFNSAKPVITGAEFKAGDKGFTINMDVRELDPTGMTPKIAFYRSNGTSVESAAVTNVGNIFSYTLLGNELAVPGIVVADLKFYDGDDQRISSASFIFTAIADTLDGLGGGTESYSDELEQLSAEFQDTLDDYIDAFGNTAPINPRGDYDNTATYEPRDMVYDSNTGTSWVAKVETTGHAPANGSAYWQKLVNGAGSSMNFDDLDDVDMTGVQDGQFPAYDANSGTYKPTTPSSGGVTSFNGRTGAVSPSAGDYNASQIDYDNTSSGYTASKTQAAIDEVITKKASKSDLSSIIAIGATNATGGTINVGTVFYLNGTLVKAKADIASGATFTNGTNYEILTSGALNSVITSHSVTGVTGITVNEQVCVRIGNFLFLNITFGATSSFGDNAKILELPFPLKLRNNMLAYGYGNSNILPLYALANSRNININAGSISSGQAYLMSGIYEVT